MTGAPREMDWEVMSSEVMGVSHSPTGAVFCTAMTVMQAVVVPALCGLRLHKSIARSAQRNLVRDSGKALRTSMGTAPMPDVPHRITPNALRSICIDDAHNVPQKWVSEARGAAVRRAAKVGQSAMQHTRCLSWCNTECKAKAPSSYHSTLQLPYTIL